MALSQEKVKEIADRAEGIKPEKPEAVTGRPSRYKPTFAKQAEKLCALGATDEDLADFFEVCLADIARWAWGHKPFFDAITPSAAMRERWAQERKARRATRNAARRRRRAQSPHMRVVEATRARIWASLKGSTDGALFSRLGYTKKQLISHLEDHFQPGMSWENYGTWHVDHVRPCASFDMTRCDQFRVAWALDNLQPLWAADNIRKGARYAGA